MDCTFDELDMIVPIASIYGLCNALDTANMLSLATNGSMSLSPNFLNCAGLERIVRDSISK
jgi:hypothetical protein